MCTTTHTTTQLLYTTCASVRLPVSSSIDRIGSDATSQQTNDQDCTTNSTNTDPSSSCNPLIIFRLHPLRVTWLRVLLRPNPGSLAPLIPIPPPNPLRIRTKDTIVTSDSTSESIIQQSSRHFGWPRSAVNSFNSIFSLAKFLENFLRAARGNKTTVSRSHFSIALPRSGAPEPVFESGFESKFWIEFRIEFRIKIQIQTESDRNRYTVLALLLLLLLRQPCSSPYHCSSCSSSTTVPT